MAKHAGDEAYLEAAAGRALDGAEVEAAGLFSWAGLLVAQAGGVIGGSVVGDLVSGGNALASGAGAVVGQRAAVNATAAAKGMTVALLVAVTADAIYVMRWEGDEAGEMVRRFDRAATDVHVAKMGLSRIVRLHDTASDEVFELHGSVAPISAQSKPDKVVLHLLSA